ncbi:hypothetical protein DAPPUDRAFT_262941 [Daphnia pulex]|uniref:Uncharacterized protein n=1 Tax=Daphnia pulex TaxID=6669 RepID=E9HNZ0_DAPPU|nr:hypothetical protein DAPPUDRAFT_262941 [Daphnia pulex]|eukprot:EFX66548.1 hypothetical protein DAPPUDRAFT_262941 [Daphnia pulex]
MVLTAKKSTRQSPPQESPGPIAEETPQIEVVTPEIRSLNLNGRTGEVGPHVDSEDLPAKGREPEVKSSQRISAETGHQDLTQIQGHPKTPRNRTNFNHRQLKNCYGDIVRDFVQTITPCIDTKLARMLLEEGKTFADTRSERILICSTHRQNHLTASTEGVSDWNGRAPAVIRLNLISA